MSTNMMPPAAPIQDPKVEAAKPGTKEFDAPAPTDFSEAIKVDKNQNPWAVMIDYIKTVITLASGILGFSVTFVNALVGTAPSRTVVHLVEAAWFFLIVTIASALFAVGSITGYLRGKRKETKPAPMLCNVSYFALGLALAFFALAGAARLNQLTSPPGPKPQQVGFLTKLGTVGPFASGAATLCDVKATEVQCENQLKSAFAGVQFAQLPHTPGFLILIGSADRERLTPSALHRYGSNAGLARGRSEWVSQELAKRYPQAVQKAEVVSLYTGPNPFENAAQAKSDPDRRVEIWAGATSDN